QRKRRWKAATQRVVAAPSQDFDGREQGRRNQHGGSSGAAARRVIAPTQEYRGSNQEGDEQREAAGRIEPRPIELADADPKRGVSRGDQAVASDRHNE